MGCRHRPADRHLERPVHRRGGASVAFSPDGTTLAVVDGSDGVGLWDVTTDRLIAALTKPDDSADTVAFSPDGRMLAVDGLNGDTALWDVTNGHLITTLDSPSSYARMSLVFASDGQMLATADADDNTDVWDVAPGRLVATLTAPDGGAVSGGRSARTAVRWPSSTMAITPTCAP